MASVEDLERRIQVLEDIEEIRKLKHKCNLYADTKDGENFSKLFAKDGGFGSKIMGELKGEALKSVKFWPFQVHYSTNPIIEVDGDTATGRWYFFRPHTTHENVARWAGGYYEDEYIREDGSWKFKKVQLSNWFLSEYDTGFAKDRGAELQVGEKYEAA